VNINKSQLIETLAKLKPGLAHKDIIEGNVCFQFYEDSVVTFNDNIFMSLPFPSGIKGGVRAEELFKLLTKLKEDEIAISIEGNEFRLQSGKTEAGIALVDIEYPQLTPVGEWQELSQELLEAIELTKFSVSSNMTMPRLTCIHVMTDRVVSSDGYRLTCVSLEKQSPFEFLLPGFAAQHLSDYNLVELLVEPNWIHFRNTDGLSFSVRSMEGEFLSTEQVDSYMQVDGPTLVFPAIEDTLDRCKLMADGDVAFETKVELAFQENVMTCLGQKELGWVKEEVEVEYIGNPFKIFINPTFLAEILKRTTQVVVGDSRCLFIGEKFKHVMVLIEG